MAYFPGYHTAETATLTATRCSVVWEQLQKAHGDKGGTESSRRWSSLWAHISGVNGVSEKRLLKAEGPIWDPGRRKSPKAATHPGSLVVWFCRENRQVRLPPAPWHRRHTEPSTCLRWLEKAELSGGSQLGYHILAPQQRAVWRGLTRRPTAPLEAEVAMAVRQMVLAVIKMRHNGPARIPPLQ